METRNRWLPLSQHQGSALSKQLLQGRESKQRQMYQSGMAQIQIQWAEKDLFIPAAVCMKFPQRPLSAMRPDSRRSESASSTVRASSPSLPDLGWRRRAGYRPVSAWAATRPPSGPVKTETLPKTNIPLIAQGFQCRLQERSHSRRSLQTRGLFHRAGQVRSGCWGADTPRGEPIQLLTHSLSESQENVRGDACQPLDIHVTDSTAPKEEDDDDTRSGTLHFYLPSPQCEEQEEEEEKRDTRPQNVNIGPFEALEVSPVLKPSTDRREENKKEIKRNASARPLSAVLQPRTQISSVTPTLKRKQMPIRQNLPAATSVVWLGSSDNISTDPEEKDLRGKDPWCTNSVNIPPLKTAQPNSPGGKGSSHRSVVHKHNYNYYERAVLTPGIHNIKLKTTKTLEFGHRGPREIKTVYVLQASSRRPKSACYPNSVSSLAKRYHTPSLSF